MLAWRGLTAILLIAAACAAHAATPEEWIRIQTPHFTVITDAGEKRGREVAQQFEAMRALFDSVLVGNHMRTSMPVHVFAFRNTREMRANSPLWHGRPIELSGFFQKAQDDNYVAVDLSTPAHWNTVFHEYAHVLINANFERMPLWFDEGVAEFYSTIDISSKTTTVGMPPQGALFALRSLMPVEQLFSVAHDSSVYNEKSDHRNQFYAEAWLVVHYLMDNQLLGKTEEYIHLLDDHAPVEEAIQRAYGVSARELNQRLAEYVERRKFEYVQVKTPAALRSFTYTTAKLPPAEVIAAIADLHLHMPEYRQQARQEFEQAVASEPDLGIAHRGLGYLCLEASDYGCAASEFGKAAAADSNDVWVHYYAGMLGLRQHPDDDAEVAASRRELEQAVLLNPGFAEAYAQLGEACERLHDNASAINAWLRAVALSPRDDYYALQLGRQYMYARNWAAAEPLLQRVSAATDPELSAAAIQGLGIVTKMRALPPEQVIVDGDHFTAVLSRRRNTPVPGDYEDGIDGDEPPVVPPGAGAMKSVHGTLVRIECAYPAATLTLSLGDHSLRLTTPDYRRLVLVGGDGRFSCSWQDRPVVVNYREGGSGDGTVVALELK